MSTNFCVIYNDACGKSADCMSYRQSRLSVSIIMHHMENQSGLESEFDYPAQAPSGERGRGGQMRMGRIYSRPAELLRCTTGRIGTTTAWCGGQIVAVRQRQRMVVRCGKR